MANFTPDPKYGSLKLKDRILTTTKQKDGQVDFNYQFNEVSLKELDVTKEENSESWAILS